MPHTATLAALTLELEAVRTGQAASAAVLRSLRTAHDLLAALTPRHRHALDEILTRMESGSLFSEKSCSFSQGELRDALAQWLAQWLAHASQYLTHTEQTA